MSAQQPDARHEWRERLRDHEYILSVGECRAIADSLDAQAAEIADLQRRFNRLTDAMARWDWGHCTTEEDLIEQIDLMKDQNIAMQRVLRALFWRHPPNPPLTDKEYAMVREVLDDVDGSLK